VRGGVGGGIGEGRAAVCGREVSEALYLKQALWKGGARSPELRSMSSPGVQEERTDTSLYKGALESRCF